MPPLAGVPVGIKDVLVTKGIRTTAGSKILGNYVPPHDCTAVARMEAAGAVVLGKLNCDEFAMGSSNENSAWKPVHNPRDLAEFQVDRQEDQPQPSQPTWQSQLSPPTPVVQSASRHLSAEL